MWLETRKQEDLSHTQRSQILQASRCHKLHQQKQWVILVFQGCWSRYSSTKDSLQKALHSGLQIAKEEASPNPWVLLWFSWQNYGWISLSSSFWNPYQKITPLRCGNVSERPQQSSPSEWRILYLHRPWWGLWLQVSYKVCKRYSKKGYYWCCIPLVSKEMFHVSSHASSYKLICHASLHPSTKRHSITTGAVVVAWTD